MLHNYKPEESPQTDPILPEVKLKSKHNYNEKALHFFDKKKYSHSFPQLRAYTHTRFPNYRSHDKILKEISSFIKRPFLSLEELGYFLRFLTLKNLDIEILKNTQSQKDILSNVTDLLDMEEDERDENFEVHRVEIFWSLQQLHYTYDDFKIYPNIIDCFIDFLQENPPLAYLHLSSQLNITSYVLKKAINPFPALIAEIKKIDQHLETRKLLKSFSLLGYQKEDMTKEERENLLDTIPHLLKNINIQLTDLEKIRYLKTLVWIFARLNFNFNDLENRTINNKSITDYIYEFYMAFQNEMVSMKNISIFLWSMAVINIPSNHKLYMSFIQKSVSIIEEFTSKKYTLYSVASQILQSKIAYQFHLSDACIERLQIAINKRKPPTSSMLHLRCEKIIIT
ncbi:MAG: hypothetical protein JO131_09845, partial [Gammaproteobacteria bacterium]|nr:hypothetical protein [Gammaproteobacteria bacterium]